MRNRIQYSSLPDRTIRVLRLELSQDLFSGRLEHRSIDEPGAYYALSYNWARDGDGPRCFLSLTDGILEIGDNLAQFFAALGGTGTDLSVPFWIDAICIDQDNDDEKMTQIPMMGTIYSSAIATIVWLGAAEEATQTAFAALPEINRSLCKADFDPATSHLSLNRAVPTSLLTHMMPLCSVLIRSWFQRLWTMQEYVLADKVVFMCGQAALDSSVLLRFIYLYKGLNLESNEALGKPLLYSMMRDLHCDGVPSVSDTVEARSDPDDNALIHLPKLDAMRTRRLHRSDVSSGRVDLSEDIDVLVSTFEKKAQVPSDSIYGLLAMLRHPTFSSVPVTTSSTSVDVFLATCTAILSQRDNKERLALLHYAGAHSAISGLPSWVPNFNARLKVLPLSPFDSKGEYLYAASASLDKLVSRPLDIMTMASGHHSLSLPGYHVDRIEDIVDGETTDFSNGRYPIFTPNAQMEWEQSCFDLVIKHTHCQEAKNLVDRRSCSHPTLLSLPESYVATLVAGSTILGMKRCRSQPTERTYREYKWRLSELCDPQKQTFHYKMHNPEHPGVRVNKEMLYGKGDLRGPLYISEEKELYHARMFEVCRGRSFFITRAGRLGLASRVKVGDEIVLFEGARTPFAVRRTSVDPSAARHYFELLGEAYVHGIMDGEGLRDSAGRARKQEWIQLV